MTTHTEFPHAIPLQLIAPGLGRPDDTLDTPVQVIPSVLVASTYAASLVLAASHICPFHAI